MTQISRNNENTGWFHVCNRGGRRQAIFLDDQDRKNFLDILANSCERYGVTVGAYCLMGNHYHLLMHCPDGRLSIAMQLLQARYTKRFNWRHKLDGSLFKGKFWSNPIDSDDYLMTVAFYIHRNPVALGKKPTEYEWSDLGSPNISQPWLNNDLVVASAGGLERYRKLVDHLTRLGFGDHPDAA